MQREKFVAGQAKKVVQGIALHRCLHRLETAPARPYGQAEVLEDGGLHRFSDRNVRGGVLCTCGHDSRRSAQTGRDKGPCGCGVDWRDRELFRGTGFAAHPAPLLAATCEPDRALCPDGRRTPRRRGQRFRPMRVTIPCAGCAAVAAQIASTRRSGSVLRLSPLLRGRRPRTRPLGRGLVFSVASRSSVGQSPCRLHFWRATASSAARLLWQCHIESLALVVQRLLHLPSCGS